MALTDPQTTKVEGTTITLPRVSTGQYASEYLTEDGKYKLSVSTTESSASRKRQSYRIDLTEITADPFIPTQNTEVSMSAYIVVDRPPAGFANAKAEAVVSALIESLTKETNANLKKFLSSQS